MPQINLTEEQYNKLQNGEPITITPPKKQRVPELGQTYWYINSYNEKCESIWFGYYDQLARLKARNVYPTEEACDRAVEYNNAINEVNNYIDEHFPFEPDWSDGSAKYELEYDYDDNKWQISANHFFRPITELKFLDSENHAQQTIKNCAPQLEIIKNYKV